MLVREQIYAQVRTTDAVQSRKSLDLMVLLPHLSRRSEVTNKWQTKSYDNLGGIAKTQRSAAPKHIFLARGQIYVQVRITAAVQRGKSLDQLVLPPQLCRKTELTNKRQTKSLIIWEK